MGSEDRSPELAELLELYEADKEAYFLEVDRRHRENRKRSYIETKLAPVDPDSLLTFDTLEPGTDSFEAARSYAERLIAAYQEPRNDDWRVPRGFLLEGLPGIGKTHLMVATMHALLEAGVQVKWMNAQTFIRQVQETYSEPPEGRSRPELIKLAGNNHVVMVDDLGKERFTEDVDTIWYDLFDHLDDRTRTLITSTNVELRVLYKRYNRGTISRLEGMCKFLKVEGESRRRGGSRGYRNV